MRDSTSSSCAAGVGFSTKEDIHEAMKEALALTENVQDPDVIFVQMTTCYLAQVKALETNILDLLRGCREDIAEDCALYGMGATSVGCCSSKGEIMSAATDSEEGCFDGCAVSRRLFAVGFVSFNNNVLIQEFTVSKKLARSGGAKSQNAPGLSLTRAARSAKDIPAEAPYDCMMLSGSDISPQAIREKFESTLVSGGFLIEGQDLASGTLLGKKVCSNKLTGGLAFKLRNNIVVENLIVRGAPISIRGHFETREEVDTQMREAFEIYESACEERRSDGLVTKPIFAFLHTCRGRLPGFKAEFYKAAHGDMERFSSLFPGLPILTHYSGGEKLPDSDKPEMLSCVFNVFCEVSQMDGFAK